MLDTYLRKISKDEINELPLKEYTGPIHIINSLDQIDFALSILENETLLGFDTETKPSFKKGQVNLPALLQLACRDCVILFQLSLISFPSSIKKILADPSVIKTGVAVKDDIKGLKRLSPFEESAFIDLGDLSRQIGMKTNGLRNLAANLLGFRISKNTQRSNWERHCLTKRQLIYAATDAWISRELHLCFQRLELL